MVREMAERPSDEAFCPAIIGMLLSHCSLRRRKAEATEIEWPRKRKAGEGGEGRLHESLAWMPYGFSWMLLDEILLLDIFDVLR